MIHWSWTILVAIAVISVQLTTSSLEAQSQGLIRGNVANTDGKPIGGVTITLSSPTLPDYQKEIAADKKGSFK